MEGGRSIQWGAVPRWRRPLFRALLRVLPEVEPARVWERLDVEAPLEGELGLEARLTERLAPWRGAMAWGMCAFFLGGVGLVWGVGPWAMRWAEAEAQARWGLGWTAWSVPLAMGALVHGLFILMVHEATHKNVFQGRRDRWLGNACLGALLLPFLAESYQHTHYVHHRWANTSRDNNWTPTRHKLFRKARWLYALYELIPVVNNVDRLADRVKRQRAQVLWAWAVALAVVWGLEPGFGYWLAVLLGLNAVNAQRLWIEHFGVWQGRASNVYACPLSFGIGNHALHHERPKLPALVLMLGLWFRRKDATIYGALWRLLFDPRWSHFRTQQHDFDEAEMQ